MNLEFPFPDAPEPGAVITIKPGILWARLALPFRLNHVNIFFLEDDDGWYIVDAGISDPPTRAAWETLIAGPFAGARFKGLIITHQHPDHIGLAGWLCERLDIPLLMSRQNYLACLTLFNSPELLSASTYSRFYIRNGMSEEIGALVSTFGHEYMRMLSKPPFTFTRLRRGDTLRVGGRTFDVLSGDGHCPEQLMFNAPAEGIFLAADQIIEKISPNISVQAFEPDGDPLGDYLASLDEIAATIPDDTLVLAGHRLPFKGAAQRALNLKAHHAHRCEIIAEACAKAPMSAAALIPVMFERELTPHEMSFAFSEVLAHLNYMAHRGEIEWQSDAAGHRLARTV